VDIFGRWFFPAAAAALIAAKVRKRPLALPAPSRSGDEMPWEEDDVRWTAARLRSVLMRQLGGDQVVVVANREPFIHEQRGKRVEVLHPASGLVTALEPVLEACSGTWIAHGSGSADRENSDVNGALMVPPGAPRYRLRRVWLTPEEEKGYYYGAANEALWPLCHLAHARPIFRRSDWDHYRTVNERFAETVVEEAGRPDPVVLVQDYHFALLPRLIRKRLPRATILTFWHIPWPNPERFGICPWAAEIVEGLLGSTIVGFHTQLHCNNFLDSADRSLELRVDRERHAIVLANRETAVRPYPISIEWPSRWIAASPPVAECRQGVRAAFALAPDALVGVGVDRLDYTKGIEERLLAVDRLLERFPALRGRFVFLQLAAPSRTRIERYAQLADDVATLTGRINKRWGKGKYRPVILAAEHQDPSTVFRYFRAADACYVSSLHAGMNLVAKEFVAARDDLQGALVLSRFTGAARELTAALIVNPYDLEEASGALALAVEMDEAEQRARMQALRATVAENNVFRWAGRMLADGARARVSDRLTSEVYSRTRLPGQESLS
jgi:trehalose 6-phosphate synthase